uniref:Uncharacterized protein n=1 Tax=Tetranychus urticae TaxID=32264 RepID=T1KKG6_TETUR
MFHHCWLFGISKQKLHFLSYLVIFTFLFSPNCLDSIMVNMILTNYIEHHSVIITSLN